MKALDAIAGYEQELPEAALRQLRIVEEFLEDEEEAPVIVKKRPSRRKKDVEELDEKDYSYDDEDLEEDLEEDFEEDFEEEQPVMRSTKKPIKKEKIVSSSPPSMQDAVDAMEVNPVVLSTDFGKFKLPAKGVMVNEFSLAFFLSEDSSLSLSMGACFELEYKDKTYQVCYAGGSFKVNDTDKYRLLTFMQQV